MITTRVIPVLLLKGRGLFKTVNFKNPTYLGDPVNAVRIFNDKEVDELVLLDITATIEKRKPNVQLISDIATECFMPLSFGGGIQSLEDIRMLIGIGVEKVIINSYAVKKPSFVGEAAALAGSSSIVVSIDVRNNFWGKQEVFTHSGTKSTGLDPVKFAQEMEAMGAGELLLNSIDRDGAMKGYDLELVRRISQVVHIPVVACGGAATVNDLSDVVSKGGASAAAAGSMFVFQGRHRAVLISYPCPQDLKKAFEH